MVLLNKSHVKLLKKKKKKKVATPNQKNESRRRTEKPGHKSSSESLGLGQSL